MRRGLLPVLVGVLAACGGVDAKARELARAALREGAPPAHAELPRRGSVEIPPGPMRDLIALGEAAVPALVEQLDDGRLGPVAAFALAEIGGEEAARGVWARYEALMPGMQRRLVYQSIPDRRGMERRIKLGERIVGADGALVAELEYALSSIGAPVTEEMIAALDAARSDAERRAAAGESLAGEETRPAEGGVARTERWDAVSAQSAGQLLRILGFLGDPRAVPAIGAALRSPVEGVRFDALAASTWLDDVGLVPLLAQLLDRDDWWSPAEDVRMRHVAAARILELAGEPGVGGPPVGGEQGEALVARCRALRERRPALFR